ncbi:MAG: glycosyltransferase family 2 protein [Planctomycetota bacterium]|jgi:glycosyltransferase involved in cell wall biosynthesis
MTETDKIMISAVIPAYNAAKYIARSIDSVLAQTHPVDEIVIVDDGSTDNTAAIIKDYGDKVRYIHQPNAGVSAARNTGIEAATGNWIAFLDADDEWLPEKIKRQVENLNKYPNLAWTIGNYYECLCDENHRAEQYPRRKIRKLLNDRDYFESYFIAWRYSLWGCSDVQMIRRDVLIESGLFPVGQKIAEDIDTWLRVAYLHPEVGFIAEPLAVYHFDNSQSGQQMHRRERFQVDFIERHFKLAEQAGMTDAFRPAAVFMARRWIRSMLFEGRKAEIRELLNRFSQSFSSGYRCLIYTMTVFPSLTVFGLRAVSKIVRALKLRRRVTRRPSS